MIKLDEDLFTKDEIEFIKWYDEIRNSGRSYQLSEDEDALIACVYGGDEYINKLDMELKITKADRRR